MKKKQYKYDMDLEKRDLKGKDEEIQKCNLENTKLNRRYTKLKNAYQKLSDLKISVKKQFKDKQTQILDERIHDNLFHNEHRMGISLYEKLESQIIVKNEGNFDL